MRTIRTAKKRRALLDAVAAGYSITRAARRARLSRSAVYDWRSDDPAFARDLLDAYEEGTDNLHDAVVERALLPDHDGLLIWLLKQRDPARFNRKAIEITTTAGWHPSNPVTIEHEPTIAPGGEEDEVVHFYLPDNGRARPDPDDEPPMIDGVADGEDVG